MPWTTVGLDDGACSALSTAASWDPRRSCRRVGGCCRRAGPARTHAAARCSPVSLSSAASLPAVPSIAPPPRGRPACRPGSLRFGAVHEKRCGVTADHAGDLTHALTLGFEQRDLL